MKSLTEQGGSAVFILATSVNCGAFLKICGTLRKQYPAPVVPILTKEYLLVSEYAQEQTRFLSCNRLSATIIGCGLRLEGVAL